MQHGLRIVLITQVMQQLSGINAGEVFIHYQFKVLSDRLATVMYYSTEILSNVLPTGAQYISLLVAVANCTLTFAPILLEPKLGRKKLLVLSAALCAITTSCVGFGIRASSPLLSSVSVIAFVSSFSLGARWISSPPKTVRGAFTDC